MTNWIIFFLIIQVIHFLGTWKLYQKAGRQSWEALVPIYNAYILTKIINRPWWWIILLFIPIINLMMFPSFWVETVRSFGKEKTGELFLVVFTFGFYIYYLNYVEDVKYNKDRQLRPFTAAGEWTTSIVFAVIAATIVHTYFIRPYNIPTSSLEKTLLVGDFLFVSKIHYGAPTPHTPISFPMVHDTLPIPYTGIKFKSYVSNIQIPSFRLPGFQKIKRNDIVVFYWPADTVRFFRDNSGIHAYKPLDKKSNYVKRCVAIPGDSLQIKNGDVFINGKLSEYPDRTKLQSYYKIVPDATFTGLESFMNKYNVTEGGRGEGNILFLNLTNEAAAKLKENKRIKSIEKIIDTSKIFNDRIFPHASLYNWNIDNYGPIYIPEKNKTVKLDIQTLPLYKRIIEEYEHNSLKVKENNIYINDQLVHSYTFKQDYYWMMGDNRQNSEDARYWGYVPFDHVVGKPTFIWFSLEQFNPDNPKGFFKRIRWDRIFTTVGGSGKPVSYIPHFLIALAVFYSISFYIKKKSK